LFGALDHQRRVLHQSSLPYLSEDRDTFSYQLVVRGFQNNTIDAEIVNGQYAVLVFYRLPTEGYTRGGEF
jgi:hypothetical protein